MHYLDTLSTFAAGLRFAELHPAVRAHTGRVLADTLAAIAAGSAEPELRALAQRQRLGSGATLIGLGVQTHPEAAALLRLSPKTLAGRRSAGTAPPWVQLGGPSSTVLYPVDELERWLEAHTHRVSPAPHGAGDGA